VYNQPQLFYNTIYPGMFTQLILVTSVYSTIYLPVSAAKPIFVIWFSYLQLDLYKNVVCFSSKAIEPY
jgi:hypothetical protein